MSVNVPSWLFLIERRRGGIVGDVDIGPAVIIEIGDQHAEPVGARRLQNARLRGDVGERAVAVVVEENVLAALQPRRAAGHHACL